MKQSDFRQNNTKDSYQRKHDTERSELAADKLESENETNYATIQFMDAIRNIAMSNSFYTAYSKDNNYTETNFIIDKGSPITLLPETIAVKVIPNR